MWCFNEHNRDAKIHTITEAYVYNEKNLQTNIIKVTNFRTLCDVMNDISCKTMFSKVFKLLRIFLTIPAHNSNYTSNYCHCRKVFSTLRHLKAFLWSSMSQPRLNHVMVLHIHKNKTGRLESINIAKEFVSFNDQRKNFWKLLM